MSNFEIFRSEKLSKLSDVSKALSHDLRLRDTQNANPNLYEMNIYSSKDKASVINKIESLIAGCDEIAKEDPVFCIQYFVGASPEKKEDPNFNWSQFFDDALNSLKEKHGAENVVFSAIHYDETTPHMTVYVVPVVNVPASTRKRNVITGRDDNGNPIRETKEFTQKAVRRLSAAHWLDGSKKTSALQDWFHDNVGIKHGLDRGVRGSEAKHTRIKQFYSEINSEIEKINLPDIRQINGETLKETQNRVTSDLSKQIAPVFEKARSAAVYKKKNKEAQQTNKKLSDENQRLRNIIEASDMGFKASDLHGNSFKKAADNALLEVQTVQLKGELENLNNKIQQQQNKYEIDSFHFETVLNSKRESVANDIKRFDGIIADKKQELDTLDRSIATVKNTLRGFVVGLSSALTAMYAKDLSWFKNSLDSLKVSARECVKACPDLEKPIIDEARSVDTKIEQRIFEPAIKEELNKMKPQ
jgi:hypothetical protein